MRNYFAIFFKIQFCSSSDLEIGHFTQLVMDRNNKVGCAISTYYQNLTNTTYYSLACNYASTNVIGYPVYRVLKGRSECKSMNVKYPGLCDRFESIDPNELLKN